jgi:hypothetical protein
MGRTIPHSAEWVSSRNEVPSNVTQSHETHRGPPHRAGLAFGTWINSARVRYYVFQPGGEVLDPIQS